MKKLLLFLMYLLLLPSFGLGQEGWEEEEFPMIDSALAEIFEKIEGMETPISEIEALAQIYIETHPENKRFAEEFAKWDGFWHTHASATGDLTALQKAYIEYATASNYEACNQNGDWHLIGPHFTGVNATLRKMGRVQSVYSPPANPSTIYVGSNTGGLWKTTNLGQNWTPLLDNPKIPSLGVQSIVGDKQNPNTLYISTGKPSEFFTYDFGIGVLRSFDAGATWQGCGNLSWSLVWGPIVRKLVMHPDINKQKVIYAMTNDEIHKSYNQGSSWVKIFDRKNPDNLPTPPSSIPTSLEGILLDMEISLSDSNTLVFTIAKTWPKNAGIWKLTQNPLLPNAPWTAINITPANTYLEASLVTTTESDPDNFYLMGSHYQGLTPGFPNVPVDAASTFWKYNIVTNTLLLVKSLPYGTEIGVSYDKGSSSRSNENYSIFKA